MSCEEIPYEGYIPPGGVFWSKGPLQLIRHCDVAFELLCNGIQVMPIGRFEPICNYLWAEFEVM